jgi:hypothetical protein
MNNLNIECDLVASRCMGKGEDCTVPVIKKIREITGCGLIDAKKAFDEWKASDFQNVIIVPNYNKQFENTFRMLVDSYNRMHCTSKLSESENNYRTQLIELCWRINKDFESHEL